MDHKKDGLSRRGFLEIGSAAAVSTAGILLTGAANAQSSTLGVRTGRSRSLTDPGPTDTLLDAANPDSNVPPLTDAGGMPTFKYPFSLANKRVYEGGWSREVTVRELPLSKTIAGVNMRLNAGGIRELHWHTAAEWAIMLKGSTRITAVDDDGRSFVRDTHAARGAGKEFRRQPAFPRDTAQRRAFHISGSRARAACHRPENSGGSIPFVYLRLLFSNQATKADDDHEQWRGADRGLEHV